MKIFQLTAFLRLAGVAAILLVSGAAHSDNIDPTTMPAVSRLLEQAREQLRSNQKAFDEANNRVLSQVERDFRSEVLRLQQDGKEKEAAALNKFLGTVKDDLMAERMPHRETAEKVINQPADRADAILWPANGHRYKFFRESLSWDAAKKFCEDKGGHLLMLETRAEHEFVVPAFQRAFAVNKDRFGDGVSCWMGATELQIDGQGQWRWIGANEAMGFTKWRGHHPHRVEKDRDYLTLSIVKGDWVNFWGKEHPDVFVICEWDR